MKLIRHTAVVGAITLISRITGFARDLVIARIFGASAATDALFVALRIPNLMRRLFAEGAFSMALVPVLTEARHHKDPAEFRAMVDAISGTLTALLLIVVVLGVLGAGGLIWLFAPGFVADPALFELAETLLRITFPYALFISLVALAAGILNTCGRFTVPALTPIVLNVSLITAALAIAPRFDDSVIVLAWAVFGAGIVQLAIQLPALARLGLLPRPRLQFDHPAVRRIRAKLLPTLLGSSGAQLNLVVDTLMASLLATGAISWLYYSDRLLEFPLGVFAIAISTVILPTLAQRHHHQDREGFARTLDWGLRLGLLVAAPATLGLAILAGPIVATLFHHGQFDEQAVVMTATSVVCYAVGLPGHVVTRILTPAFYAGHDLRAPVRITLITVAANILLNVGAVVLLQRNSVLPPHAGLALASSVAAWLQAALLFRTLRSRGDLRGSSWFRHLVAIGVACAVMAAALITFAAPWRTWLALPLLERIGELTLLIVGGAVIYAVIALALGAIRRELFDAPA